VYNVRLKSLDIWSDTDDEVLRRPGDSDDERARTLAKKLKERRIFKPIYLVQYRSRDESIASKELWGPKGLYARLNDPDACDAFARKLEHLIGLELGDSAKAIGTVCISCPDDKMNLKAFDMLVLRAPDKPVHRLHDSGYGPTKLEIAAITEAHQHLWRFQVIVDPEVVSLVRGDALATKLAAAIAHEAGPKNEVSEFVEVPAHSLADWENELQLRAVLSDLAMTEKITHQDHLDLEEAVFRSTHSAGVSDPQQFRDDVEAFLAVRKYI
jgi:hypothetical protein